MPTQRIHKLLLGTKPDGTATNIFPSVPHPEKPSTKLLDLSASSQQNNPSWPAYGTACLELQKLEVFGAPTGASHQQLVLRAWARCCCSPACPYPADHGDSMRKRPIQGMMPLHTAHGPAQGYVESSLSLTQLATHQVEADRAAASPAAATALGAELKAEADLYQLTATEIDGFLGGLLSGLGAAAAVLSGTSAVASDYYAVAAFLRLYQLAVERAHNMMSRAWPLAPSIQS
ncbi:MAG: hypothetical protein KGL39_49695 [Patescibacteria group bacterium]|nr:hypothetical protein [Patescibacteria group bacterium]